ncbi:MAG TPA: hypothetical protein VM286_07690 [Candidatus Thermoplasmatota archaeon]|nr:hypothetical protein [Candidatus Thermoplasmatota archaeon]
MTPPTLAPIYLDNQPVSLLGDPRPQVAKVVAAMGKHPERFDVRRLDSPAGSGLLVDLEDILDRTAEPTKPIYLTTIEKETGLEDPGEGAAEVAGPGTAPSTLPGVSGQGNSAGSAQSAYSRTGTDTAEPGMVGDFGSGAGKGISSMTPQSGKSTPSTPTPGLPAAAGPSAPKAVPDIDPAFGKEGLHGKQGQGATSLRNGLKTDVTGDAAATGQSGTASELHTLEDDGSGSA